MSANPFGYNVDPASVPEDHPVLGGSQTPGPLGLSTGIGDGVAELDNTSGKPPAAKAVELNVIADFPNAYGGIANEVQAIKNKTWGPTTDDFNAIVGNAVECDSMLAFAAVILLTSPGVERAKKSIRRINLFTHANPNLIAFQGTVKPLTIGVDVQLFINGAISSSSLQVWNAPGFSVQDPKTKKNYGLDDIRARFTDDAEIWLYACHSGVDGKLCRRLQRRLKLPSLASKMKLRIARPLRKSPRPSTASGSGSKIAPLPAPTSTT